MSASSIVSVMLGLILAPLLFGVINRTKAWFAGRRGQPLLQTYHDLMKLLRKGAVYSRTTTLVFRLAPAVELAAILLALAILPAGGVPAVLAFSGDIVLFIYALGLMRFFTVAAALDTGSSFEGMGASREVYFSALAEPAAFIGLAVLVRLGGGASLSVMFSGIGKAAWLAAGPALALVAVALLIVFLAENARIPVDDPNTHLELTMIHEVMILDFSGPDLALILYATSLKLWVLGALIVNLVLTLTDWTGMSRMAAFMAGMMILAVLVGIIESVMARMRLLKVPQLLIGAGALSALALILVMRSAL
ncbi:MAG: NADH-quinone oxidoreductase subunit H [bacterium]